jgi:hypothetical protein
MSQKEKLIKAWVDLAVVDARIDELKRAKSYQYGNVYYNNRLRQLRAKKEDLEAIVDGDEAANELKLTFRIPEEVLCGERSPEKILQYLKTEHIERG